MHKNKIISMFYAESPEGEKSWLAIMETQSFPAKYYAGIVRLFDGDWCPTDNATCRFFRTLDEANGEIGRLLMKTTRII